VPGRGQREQHHGPVADRPGQADLVVTGPGRPQPPA
jgi:hypothetical protein